MKLVLDTNVVLDWLVFEDSALSVLRDKLRARQVSLLVDSHSAEELRRVLGYPTLNLDPARQGQVLQSYLDQAVWIGPAGDAASERLTLPNHFVRCRDSDDNPFLALAWRGKADALVSRDSDLLALKRRSMAFGFRILGLPELTSALKSG